jgi:hypothetical protein
VEIFNLKGESLGPSDESHLQATSRSGRFIESLHRDGQESWQIYELATKQQLFAFNCGGPDCKTGDHNDDYWNPVIDGQFAVVRDSGKAYGKGSTCDVYQTTPPHLVKSFPCDGLMVYDWSRAGRKFPQRECELKQTEPSGHRTTLIESRWFNQPNNWRGIATALRLDYRIEPVTKLLGELGLFRLTFVRPCANVTRLVAAV